MPPISKFAHDFCVCLDIVLCKSAHILHSWLMCSIKIRSFANCWLNCFCSLVNALCLVALNGTWAFPKSLRIPWKPLSTLIRAFLLIFSLLSLRILKSCFVPLAQRTARMIPVKKQTINKAFIVCSFFFLNNTTFALWRGVQSLAWKHRQLPFSFQPSMTYRWECRSPWSSDG